MAQPKVSVILPVYKASAEYLKQAIASLLGQTLADFELLIIEDPSDSVSEELVRGFNDERIKYVLNEARSGFAAQLNQGLSLSAGEYIARLDADDIAHADRLKAQMEFLDNNPHISVVGSNLRLIDEHGRLIGQRKYPELPEKIAQKMRQGNMLAHPAVMLRKSAASAARDFQSEFGMLTDYDHWARLLAIDHKFYNLQQPLVSYRLHRQGSKSYALKRQLTDTLRIKQKYFRGRADWTLLDEARYQAEKILLLLPGSLVYYLFVLITAKRARFAGLKLTFGKMTLRQNINLLKLAVKYHRVSLTKARHSLQKKFGASLEFPKLVRFFLFYGCNQKCFMCGQWGETGVSKADEVKNFLPLAKLTGLLEEIAQHKSEIYLWGGEPSLHPDYAVFLKLVRQHDLVCTVNTNGILIEKYAEDIVKNRIDSLDVSIIGPQAIHDQVVRVPNSYDQVMKGLAKLQTVSQEYGFKPLVKAIITVNSINQDHIAELLKEIEANPAIDMSIIQLGWFTTDSCGTAYEKRMKEDFGLTADSWTGFHNENIGKQADKIQEILSDIFSSGEYRKPILLFPDIKPEAIAKYYTDHSNTMGFEKCGALDREIDIRHDGEVVICADFPDYVLGNVNDETIEKIWQGEKLKKFRANIKEKGLLPICSRCCGIFH